MADPFYEYVPMADPVIRTNYEAALGRLILAHNEVDSQRTLFVPPRPRQIMFTTRRAASGSPSM
jgi:hypothetical protein